MTNTAISYSDTRDISLEAIRELYISNGWSAAKKPTFDSTIAHYIRLPSTWTGRKSVRRLGGMALSAPG